MDHCKLYQMERDTELNMNEIPLAGMLVLSHLYSYLFYFIDDNDNFKLVKSGNIKCFTNVETKHQTSNIITKEVLG